MGSLLACRPSMGTIHEPHKLGVASGASSGVSVATSRDIQGLCPARSKRVPAALASPTEFSPLPLLTIAHGSPFFFCHSEFHLVSYPVLFVLTWFHVLSPGDDLHF